MGICDGRVVIVTGAGGGLGRAHALAFAAEGARVVVNDIGTSREGEGASAGPAQTVVDEIVAAGGEAVANTDDIADWDGAEALVRTAIDAFGGLDVLVNNAGFLRDRMLRRMSVEEWDAVIRVHMRGHFCTLRHAGDVLARAVEGRRRSRMRAIINTSSGAGLMGSVGQGNYSAAKAGIVGLTLVAAAELGAVRRDRQRDRARGADADDRGRDARHDEGAGERLRRDGAGERLAARRLARLARVARRDRSGLRGRGRHGQRRRRLAARPAGRQGRAMVAGRARPVVRDLLAQGARARRRSTAREADAA